MLEESDISEELIDIVDSNSPDLSPTDDALYAITEDLIGGIGTEVHATVQPRQCSQPNIVFDDLPE